MNNGKLRTLCLKLAIPAFAVAMVLPAQGDMVTYSTTGGFSQSGGGSSALFTIGSNNATLTFHGVTANVNASPTTFSSAGDIVVTTVSATGVPLSGTFTLGIDQTVPSANNGTLAGNLTGTVSENASTGALDFTSTTLTLGTVSYTLLSTDLALVPPSTLGGETTIELQLAVTQNGGGGGNNPTPEPSFFALTGLGFAGMGVVLFRRFRKTA